MKPSFYIGLMSGTSLDAIDAVLMDFSPGCKLIAATDIPMPIELREEIRALNTPCENELQRSLILDKQLAHLFAKAVSQLLKAAQVNASQVYAIGSHGQTLRHSPDKPWGYSLQIGDANTLAELTGINVVSDFRSRDIAAGGQGAPLVPAFHQAVFASDSENRAIINIGGMANVSFLNNDDVTGFDTGPGNVLMDYWCHKHLGKHFDNEGGWAKSGQIIDELLASFLSETFFSLAPPKSTGRELFDAHWLDKHLEGKFYKPEDVQATLLELTAQSIIDAIKEHCDSLFLCGGGAYNQTLIARITELSGKPTGLTGSLGIDAQWVEAAAFSWFAKQTMEGLPSNAPTATGSAGPRILGAIYSA